MSGMAAALTAQELGADVTVLEKGPDVGGSARMSGGYIWSYQDLDELHEDMVRGNAELQRLVVETRVAGVEWLAGLGVRFEVLEPFLFKGTAHQMDTSVAFPHFERLLQERGGRVLTETAIERVVLEDGAVAGVVASSVGGGSVLIGADAVVLATGGFQGNPELVRRLVGVDPDAMLLRSNPWSTGDGLLAALGAGGTTTTSLGGFYGHALVDSPARFPPTQFAEMSQYYGYYGVALNLAGRRFADESAGSGEEVLNQAVARQPDARALYVFDARIEAGESLPNILVTSVILERARRFGANVYSGGTFDELFRAVEAGEGIPAGAASAALAGFNQAMVTGSEIDPPRRRNRQALDRPPFHAVAVRAGITFTMGGIAVDDAMRVLRRTTSSAPMATLVVDEREVRQDPVPGLYAAGVDVGGIWTGSYAGGLSLALVTGRIAGRSAATPA